MSSLKFGDVRRDADDGEIVMVLGPTRKEGYGLDREDYDVIILRPARDGFGVGFFTDRDAGNDDAWVDYEA